MTMPLPTLRDWLFGCKAFAAAMIALYIAFAVGLERPYWAMASAYIAAQPLSGATRSKAIYRSCGTVAGAAAAVVLVPPLANAPVLLSLAMTLWVGVCLFLALLDRTARSYAFMLGGYTAAIIGFPSVSAPNQVFTLAVTRVLEIGIGITVASLVISLVLPRSVAFVLNVRLDAWLGNARRWAMAALRGDADHATAVRRLAGDAVEIDAVADNLPFDATPWQVQRFLLLRERMLMLLPILSSLADRIRVMRGDGAMPPEAEAIARDVSAWVGGAPGVSPEDLLARIAALETQLSDRSAWPDLILVSLLLRMRDLVLVLSDCRMLRRQLELPAGHETRLRFAPEGTAARVWHRDPGMALLSAAAAAVAVLITCAAWIATAWPDGAVAAEMVAVACSFFAARDDPVPAILGFLRWSIVGMVIDGIVLFGLLPAATNFVSLMLVLAPFYILGGVLTSMPSTAVGGRAFVVNGATLLALSPTYNGDFPTFVNSAVAFLLGLVIAAVVTRLIRSVGAEVSANRLLRKVWEELAVAAERRGNRDRGRYAGLMLDRLGLIAPRLAETDPGAADAADEALADLRIGLNIIDLRRSRHELPEAVRAPIDAMLDTLAADFRARARRSPGPSPRARLLDRVDEALRAAAAADPGPGRADALLGLVGIRRGLFPQATAFAAGQP